MWSCYVLCCENVVWVCIWLSSLWLPPCSVCIKCFVSNIYCLKELAFSKHVLSKRTALLQQVKEIKWMHVINNTLKGGYCFKMLHLFFFQFRILLFSAMVSYIMGLYCRKHHQVSHLAKLSHMASLILFIRWHEHATFMPIIRVVMHASCNMGKLGHVSLCVASAIIHH